MSTVLTQIKGSKLSKQGLTTTTGVFEAKPENTVPNQQVPNPIDTVTNQTNITYLDTLRAAKKL